MNYNIVIPITERNLVTFSTVVRNLDKYVYHSRIVAVGKETLRHGIESYGVDFVDEDSLYDGLSLSTIKDMIVSRDKYASKRAGWYLQQFLKYAYSFRCDDDYYLTWDADTIPLNELRMFDETGHPFFDVKDEYNRPYFTTLKVLFNGNVKKVNDYSFISEHMLFSTNHVIEMLKEIQENDSVKGNCFYEKIMNSIKDVDLLGSGFSEFETYGNYIVKKYPSLYAIRRLRTLRNGDGVYGRFDQSSIDIDSIAEKYDIVTFENR